MTFDAFVDAFRDAMGVAGLPINWQPDRSSLKPFHAQGLTVADAVRYYRPCVARYERFVNLKGAGHAAAHDSPQRHE